MCLLGSQLSFCPIVLYLHFVKFELESAQITLSILAPNFSSAGPEINTSCHEFRVAQTIGKCFDALSAKIKSKILMKRF